MTPLVNTLKGSLTVWQCHLQQSLSSSLNTPHCISSSCPLPLNPLHSSCSFSSTLFTPHQSSSSRLLQGSLTAADSAMCGHHPSSSSLTSSSPRAKAGALASSATHESQAGFSYLSLTPALVCLVPRNLSYFCILTDSPSSLRQSECVTFILSELTEHTRVSVGRIFFIPFFCDFASFTILCYPL